MHGAVRNVKLSMDFRAKFYVFFLYLVFVNESTTYEKVSIYGHVLSRVGCIDFGALIQKLLIQIA